MNALRIGDTNISDGLSIGDDASVWEARFAELTETVVVLQKQLDDSVFENEYVEASIGDNGGSKGKSKTVRVGEEDDEEVRRLPLKRRVVRLEKMVKESNNAVAGLKEKIRLLETQNEELSTQQQKQGKKADNGDASADAGNTTTMGSVIMDYLLVLFSLCVMGLFTMIAPLVKLYNSKQKKNDKRSQLDKDTSHLATLWGMISTCMDHTATLVVFIRDWTVQCFSEEGIFGFMCGCCRDGTKDAQDAQIHANHSGRFRVMNRGDKGEAHERMIDKSLRKRGHRSKLKTKRRTWQSSRKALSDAYSGSGIDDNKERGRDKDREKDRYNDRERESNRGPMETPDSYTGIYSVGVDRDSGNHTPHRGTDTDEYGAGMGAGMSINLLAASNVDKGSVGSAYSGTLKEEGAISQPRSNPDLHSRNNSSFGGADVDMDTLLNHIHSNNDTDDTNEREKDLVFDHTDNITDPRSSTGTNDRQDYSQRSSPCLSPALSKQQYSPISLILNDPHDPFPFDDAYTQARGRVQSLGHSRGSSMNSLSNVPSQKQDGGRAKLEDTHDVVTSGHEFAEFLRENF